MSTLSEFEDGFESPSFRDRERTEEQRLGEAILSAPIRALDPRAPVQVTESTSIAEAIRLMIEAHVGAVLVTRQGLCTGIFTERDVLHRVAITGVDRQSPVSEVMTQNPETLRLDDGIAFALNRMIARGFRHIPILDAADRPVGVLSVRDVVSHIVSLLPARVHNLPPEPSLGIPHQTDGG